jgi:apolipoprotein N-acyltransferase
MTLQPPVAPQASPPAEPPEPIGLRAALILSVVAGAALLLALPPFDLWPLAIAGVGLLAVATHRRRRLLFYPLLHWTSFAAGWLPWALLSTAEAVFFGLTGLAIAWLRPLLDRRRGLLWPPLLGLLWVTQEALRDRAPFGGFPWGRLAFSQADAPVLRLAALGGAPAVTFGVAAAAGALVGLYYLISPNPRAFRITTWRSPAVALLAIAFVLIIAPRAIPLGGATGPARTIAIVQGNVPRLGLEFNEQRRAVLDNHVKATLQLAADVTAGKQKQPDLVVWPENSSDIDPLRNQDAASEISAAADAIRAPILVGAVLRTDNPNDIKNAGLLWVPGAGPDPTQQYVKRHPVPFAEYMPLRSIARLVSDKVDLVRNMVSGTKPGVLRTGPLTLGDVICFEVAYDGIVRDTVTGGGQLLAVQTNNATFNDAEAKQQMAMVRLRAVEHGRDSMMVSTVGVSGFVDVRGSVHQETGFNTAAVKVRAMHLSSSRTLATRLGVLPEIAVVVLTVAALAGAFVLRRGRRRTSTDEDTAKTEAR